MTCEMNTPQNKTHTASVQKLDEMNLLQRISYLILFSLGLSLTLFFGVWWFEPSHISQNFHGILHVLDFGLFVLLSYIVWHQIVMDVFAWYVAGYTKVPKQIPAEQGLRVAYLTAFVPGSEPYSMLEKTLKAMTEVDYPHDTWLLDEGNAKEAQELCKKYGVNHYSRAGREEFNTSSGKFTKKTKGGNYNSWLHHHIDSYDVIAQHDMDFIPRKDFLKKTLGYFRDPKVAFVGTPQIYGNLNESWIARGAAEQTYTFYGPLQKGFFGHDMTLLIGANHIFRTTAYKAIDGYTAHITEDMLTGMKLYAHETDWKSVYVPEALLVGEGPSTWAAYFAQQMRWAYGCMDIAFRHAPSLFPTMRGNHTLNYSILMQFYFSGVAQVVGIVLLTIYFIFGVTPANMPLLPIFVLYVPLLAYQLIFQLWLQQLNILPRIERGLLLCGKLLNLAVWPIYFLAFIGVLRGERLSYVVTPKGDQQETVYQPRLFLIHSILGFTTLAGIGIGILTHHISGPMIFWAILNSTFMLYFLVAETSPLFVRECKKLFPKIGSPIRQRRMLAPEFATIKDHHGPAKIK